MSPVAPIVEAAYAEHWGRLVARMIRFCGDWELAEEAAQEAFVAALQRWPDRVPDQPLAWLTTVARHHAVDRMRRVRVEAGKLRTVAAAARDPAPTVPPATVPDERLELMFTCCHPALAVEAQVALVLRCLGGLTTTEIARAFLVEEKTMGQRLFRAKARIAHAGVPFRVPPSHLLGRRLPAVLHVLYLVFNQGYGDRDRATLCDQSLRWTRVLAELMPDQPEIAGLLALELLTDARRPTRFDDAGDLVPLEEQDRSRWDREAIAEGEALCRRALAAGRAGPFQVQAAIAACHAAAPSAAATDWAQIAALYDRLHQLTPTDVVALNRAVAIGMADGPRAALPLVEAITAAGRLSSYHLLHATRADLLQRLGRWDEAASAYGTAAALAPTDAERRLLLARALRRVQ